MYPLTKLDVTLFSSCVVIVVVVWVAVRVAVAVVLLTSFTRH